MSTVAATAMVGRLMRDVDMVGSAYSVTTYSNEAHESIAKTRS